MSVEIEALQKGSLNGIQNIVQLVGAQKAQLLFAKLEDVRNGKAPLERVILGEIAKQITSSLDESYFSMASFLLKSPVSREPSADTAVKYMVSPIQCGEGDTVSRVTSATGPDFLAAELNDRVNQGENCFAFYLQPLPEVSLEEKRTLVEDSRLRFETSPVQVATIRIRQQDISSMAKTKYCEDLSFNPWQAQEAHQPLGSMNRARRFAVTASSIRRHLLNKAERQEPVSVQEYKAQ